MIDLRRLRTITISLTLLFMLMPSAASALKAPTTFAAATTVQSCSHTFLGLVPWYQYIQPEFTLKQGTGGKQGTCDIKCFNVLSQGSGTNDCGQKNSDIPLVLLAIIDDLLRIAALVAIGFVIFGAFRYVTSQGNSEQTAQAQSTVINALIGLAVAILSVTIVQFLGNKLQ